MMDRRRALIGTQGEKAIKLKDIPVASTFRTSDTTTTNYIFLGIINGTAWMLRELVINTASKMRNDTLCDYEGSLIDNYLTNTWVPSFAQHAKDAMEETSVTFPASDGNAVINKTISRKAFLLTYGQIIGNANNVVGTLKKYYNTTSANTARAAKDANGNGRSWWTCSANSTTNMGTVGGSGSGGNTTPNTPAGTIYRRPVVSFNKETTVKLVNGIYILA